jgi:hypothetical protein
MGCYVGLGLHVYILGAVEAGRTTGTNTVCAEGLDSLLLERFICDEVVVVVRGEVCDGAAVGQLRFGAGRAGTVSVQPRSSLERLFYPTITGLFSLSSSSWAVGVATRGSGVQSSTNSSISYSPSALNLAIQGAPHTASVSCTFFCVLYFGASRYLTAKRNRNSSIALRTGSF